MKRIEVVAAVIVRPDRSFLLAQRPEGKVYAGYWEFPGGKIERGESADHALHRELHEELGIDVELAYPWITRDYTYEHAAVRLRFFRVAAWRGQPHGREAQALSWQTADALTVAPLLPANGPVLRALGLPDVYGITNAEELGCGEFLRRLEHSLTAGLRLVQLREKHLDRAALLALGRKTVAAAHRFGARVTVNGDARLAAELGADGVHLTAARLARATARPNLPLVGASCHDQHELATAARLGVDFAVLGPVRPTPSHPDAAALGWTRFAELVDGCPVPVYALGGLCMGDLEAAWRSGAHGISMMRGAWQH